MTHPGPTHPGPSGPPSSTPPSHNVEPYPGHSYASIWGRATGHGARCSCDVTFDGFATLAEATALLDRHIADSPPEPGPLPRLGEVVRDAERALTQALNILRREYDPASAPTGRMWSGVDMPHHDVLLAFAVSQVRQAMAHVQAVAELELPPVGSAVRVPVGAGYGTPSGAAGGESRVRSGGPGLSNPPG